MALLKIATIFLGFNSVYTCVAFIPRQYLGSIHGGNALVKLKAKRGSLFLSSHSDDTVSISQMDNTKPDSIQIASEFMTDNFWLPDEENKRSNKNYGTIATSVYDDLLDRYGERMKKQKLESCIIQANTIENPSELAGLVGLDVAIIHSEKNVIFNREKSDVFLTNAVASLGPKERKRYMRSSAQKIASKLLPPEFSAVVVLSNLAVSTSLRRLGIGAKLCTEAERFANEKGWGFNEIYLKVEAENIAAKALYERLGYEEQWVENNARALRVDLDSGEFVERIKDTIVMKKAV